MEEEDAAFRSAHRTPTAADALAYGHALREQLKKRSCQLGGDGDVVVTVLARNRYKTFVRLLFTRKHGLVRYAPEDEEWKVCASWLANYAAHSGSCILSGRILIKGDLCIIIRDPLAPDLAETDAEAIVDALYSYHSKPTGRKEH